MTASAVAPEGTDPVFAAFCAAGLWPGLGKRTAAELPAAGITSPDDVTADRLTTLPKVGRQRAERLFSSFLAAAPTYEVVELLVGAGLAAKLKKDITAALATRKGTVAVGLYDRSTNTTCTLRASSAYDSASVVKVTVLATLLWDAKKANRYLTDRENTLAKAMITKSDNAATSTLWKQLGMTKIKGFTGGCKSTFMIS